jgi:hypothetical protein
MQLWVIYLVLIDCTEISINHVVNGLSNHSFDPKYFENRKKTQEKEQKMRDDKKERDDENKAEEKPKEINFAQLEGMCYCCGKKGQRNPKCPDKNKPKKDWAINKTKEAVFIQTAVTRGGDLQSMVSAPPAISQEEPPPFGGDSMWKSSGPDEGLGAVGHSINSQCFLQ